MLPRYTREAAPDAAERFGRDHLPDPRPPARYVPSHIAARADFSPLALSTPELLAETDALSMRTARRETTSRDVMLVQAMAARIRSLTPSTSREPLEGMLRVDVPEVA